MSEEAMSRQEDTLSQQSHTRYLVLCPFSYDLKLVIHFRIPIISLGEEFSLFCFLFETFVFGVHNQKSESHN